MRSRFLRSMTPGKILSVVIALTFLLYLYHFNHPFIGFDDKILITRNWAVMEFSWPAFWNNFTSYDPELYIPLTKLSYQLEVALFGAKAGVFVFTNLLLHLISIWFVYRILIRLTDNYWMAVVAAAFFALHPVNAETILWASARKDILSATFCLGSLLAYLRYLDGEYRFNYGWSLALFILSLLAKVSVAPLPVFLLLLHWYKGDLRLKNTFVRLAPFFGASLILGIVALGGKTQNLSSILFTDHLLLSFKSVAFSLWSLINPTALSILYPQTDPVKLSAPDFLISAAVTAGLAIITALAFLKKNKPVFLALSWWWLMYFPSFSTFWKNGYLFYASDRYAYLPAVGYFALFGVALAYFWRSKKLPYAKYGVTAAVAVLFLTLFLLTFRQAGAWRDTETLYRNVLKHYPRSVLALDNLAILVRDRNELNEAEELSQKALTVDPDDTTALVIMGDISRAKENFTTAGEFYRRAAGSVMRHGKITYDNMTAFYFYARTLEHLGRKEEALEQFKLAVKLAPENADAHFNLGAAYHKRGMLSEAVESYKQTIILQERYITARYHLAGIYAETGQIQPAIEQLEYVIAVDPDFEEAKKHLSALKRM